MGAAILLIYQYSTLPGAQTYLLLRIALGHQKHPHLNMPGGMTCPWG